MGYDVRPLKTKDIFTVSKIFKKIGVDLNTDGKTHEQLGAKFVVTILENLHLSKKPLPVYFM